LSAANIVGDRDHDDPAGGVAGRVGALHRDLIPAAGLVP
jgi:hypothetical protein